MIEELRRMVEAEPFVPFRVVLTSGTSYDVTGPWQLVVYPNWMLYLYRAADGEAILRNNQLAAIETLNDVRSR
jgi:hypothetical protein